MERQYVESSNLYSVGYDNGREVLEIQFRSGRIYQYFDVPFFVYEELMNAESKGSYFNRNIRGSYNDVEV